MAHHKDIQVLRRLGEQGLQPFQLFVVKDIVAASLRASARAVQENDAQALAGHIVVAIDLAGREVQVLARLLLPGFLEGVCQELLAVEIALAGVPVMIAGRIEPDAVIFEHLSLRIVHHCLGISGIHGSRKGIESDIAEIDHEVGAELIRRRSGIAYMLVGVASRRVDIGQDDIADRLVLPLPGFVAPVSFPDLGLDILVIAGFLVGALFKIGIELGPRDRRGRIREIQGLPLVEIEELDPQFMRALRKRLGGRLEDGAVGAVILDQHLPVDVELGAVVRRKLETIFLLGRDGERRGEEHGEMVHRIGQVYEVEVILDTLQVGFSQRGEIGQVILVPIVVQLILYDRFFFASAGRRQQDRRGEAQA